MKALSVMRCLSDDCVYDIFNAPVGELTLIASSKGLNAILWKSDWESKEFVDIISNLPKKPNHKYIMLTKKQLKEYFKGKRKTFDIPLNVDGTEFQKKAWSRLSKIPYGMTISYEEQAISLGNKNKVRAVGSANGRNPISIIVPCHRVIAKSGHLGGFGGGLPTKENLLLHEQAFN